jgi:hypothetical protein
MSPQVVLPQRVDRQIEGEALTVAEHVIQPVARVSGVFNHFEGENGLGGGGWLRITPLKAVVRNTAGAEHTIAFPDPNRWVVPRAIITSVVVAAGSLLITLAALRRDHGRH